VALLPEERIQNGGRVLGEGEWDLKALTQSQALDAWTANGNWGIIVLTIGNGKTLVGIKAIISSQHPNNCNRSHPQSGGPVALLPEERVQNGGRGIGRKVNGT